METVLSNFGLVGWLVVFIIAMTILLKGSDYFTDATEDVGKSLGIPNFILGVTVVSMGTSLPELVSSVFAVQAGSSEIVVGNVVGSNLTNILLILGITAVVAKKLKVSWDLAAVDLPLFIGTSALLLLTTYDGVFTTYEAIISILAFFVYFGYVFNVHGGESGSKKKGKVGMKTVGVLLSSVVAIYFGAKYVVGAVIAIAAILSIPAEIVAVSAVALGTSLPELVVSLMAVKKGNAEMAIGNILGSNIFNATLVMGVAGLFGTLIVPVTLITLYFPLIIVASLMYYFVSQDKEVVRWEGLMLLTLYALFLGTVFSGI